MTTQAVVIHEPRRIGIREVSLIAPGPEDVLVDVAWSGISTGTEKLLYDGTMPAFPGMGYPLVPGYESVGVVRDAPDGGPIAAGQTVFVPGAACYQDARGLFGASAARVIIGGGRLVPIPPTLGRNGILLSLAATAYHALALDGAPPPDLIIGHGALGRLLARVAVAIGCDPPVVWERDPLRRQGPATYEILDPSKDTRKDYGAIVDASGDPAILDAILVHAIRGCTVTLAGFYSDRVSFAFPAAFMREANIRIAAEFTRSDMEAVVDLVADGSLSLDGLITHEMPADETAEAYAAAFRNPECVKMALKWRPIS